MCLGDLGGIALVFAGCGAAEVAGGGGGEGYWGGHGVFAALFPLAHYFFGAHV